MGRQLLSAPAAALPTHGQAGHLSLLLEVAMLGPLVSMTSCIAHLPVCDGMICCCSPAAPGAPAQRNGLICGCSSAAGLLLQDHPGQALGVRHPEPEQLLNTNMLGSAPPDSRWCTAVVLTFSGLQDDDRSSGRRLAQSSHKVLTSCLCSAVEWIHRGGKPCRAERI